MGFLLITGVNPDNLCLGVLLAVAADLVCNLLMPTRQSLLRHLLGGFCLSRCSLQYHLKSQPFIYVVVFYNMRTETENAVLFLLFGLLTSTSLNIHVYGLLSRYINLPTINLPLYNMLCASILFVPILQKSLQSEQTLFD